MLVSRVRAHYYRVWSHVHIKRGLKAAPVFPYTTMSSTSSPLVHSSAQSCQVITINIPELTDPNFLDTLVPLKNADSTMPVDNDTVVTAPSNPMMDALKSTTGRTRTANNAPAYDTTGDAVLDAFQFINQDSYSPKVDDLLEKSWKQDPALTLHSIWNLRSIHDGKSQKDVFYRAFGWLLENHPRTAIQNLPELVKPVCSLKKDEEPSASHGYWKDLLNILGLAVNDELANLESESTFLHRPNPLNPKKASKQMGKGRAGRSGMTWKGPIPKKEDKVVIAKKRAELIKTKLENPVFRALYVTVARLFAAQLAKDLATFNKAQSIKDADEKFQVLKGLSLAAKWAPTPGKLHDTHTNISTAIALLLPHFESPVAAWPSILKESPSGSRDVALAMRQFMQRWFLTPLRDASHVVESRMTAQRWDEIKYSRVPSICMQNNVENFYKHDPEGLEKYLLAVESGKKTISGATLMPHQIIAEAVRLHREAQRKTAEDAGVKEKVKGKLAELELRVAEGQWKTLVNRIRDAGSLDNAIAVCDVSGSMGNINNTDAKHPSPILPAISLSLLLASVAKPPFNGGIITFSAQPKYWALNLDQPLGKVVRDLEQVDWGYNTDLNAVFTKLILPLAIKNKIKPEDMIKRIFIFTDMQFDEGAGMTRSHPAEWDTNYDKIKAAYAEHGYEVPEIVYWDLASGGTVEAKSDTPGVAMMNGFSASMLKVFMGDEVAVEEAEEEEWMDVEEDGETKVVKEEKVKEKMTPVDVMKKALMKKSYAGLVVVD
ncbi:hypothetical protein DL96DRAFT_1813896 [Flagelloscypha sp. PMI_526]|nr:hypothetical protein DL96DRAFT_1813896 [Flagelloscypha sp. PMI_526]